jgi:hypothetical protein
MGPHDWNVVVAASWNTAILTPAGVAQHLFQLPPSTPVNLQVPVDRLAPIRVGHEGCTVVVEAHQLIVGADEPTFAALSTACEVAARAVDYLPHTPFRAAGINVRCRYEQLPNELLALLECGIDDHLANHEFTVDTREVRLSLALEAGGGLNVHLRETEPASVLLNYHLDTTDGQALARWLQESPKWLPEHAASVAGALYLQFEERQDD